MHSSSPSTNGPSASAAQKSPHRSNAVQDQRAALERALSSFHAAASVSTTTLLSTNGISRSPGLGARSERDVYLSSELDRSSTRANSVAGMTMLPESHVIQRKDLSVELRRALYVLGVVGLENGPLGASGEGVWEGFTSPMDVMRVHGIRDAIDAEILRLRAHRWMRSVSLSSGIANSLPNMQDIDCETALANCVRFLRLDAPTTVKAALQPSVGGASKICGRPKFALEATGLRACGHDWSPSEYSLDRTLGLPGEDLIEGMRQEHTEGPRSHEPFTSHTFGFRTTPLDEWDFVTTDRQYPGERDRMAGRARKSLDEIMEDPKVREGGLTRAEVIALRMCTGPMKEKYNENIRSCFEGNGKANRQGFYTTTIHTIVGAAKKLADLSTHISSQIVYVGLEGLTFPRALSLVNQSGWRCGCETLGFLSATKQKQLAVQKGGDRVELHGLMPLIMEMRLGNTARGVLMEWLSQSATDEEEVLLPPLSYLEIDGEPRLDFAGPTEVLVVPVRIITPRTLTVQGICSRRKQLHVATATQILEEIRLEMIKSDKSSRSRPAPVVWSGTGVVSAGVMEVILDECEARLTQLGNRDSMWYAEDHNMKEGMVETVDMKTLALLKHSIALEHRKRGSEANVIERIKSTAIEDFNVDATVRRLRSGVEDFPWKEVSERRKEDVRMPKDMEVWQASMLWQLVLEVKESVRSVKFGGVVLTDYAEPMLRLAHTKIGLSGAKVVSGLLENNKVITSVVLPGNAIGPEGAVAIAKSLLFTTRLVELDLSDNMIQGQESLSHIISAVEANTGLVKIDLRSNALTYSDGHRLHKALESCPNVQMACGVPIKELREGTLTELDMHDQNMGPAEAALAIEALKANTSVTRLNLAGTRMGHEGAQHLVTLLSSNKSLRTLDLRNNDLSYTDGLLLAPALMEVSCPVRTLSGVPLQTLRDGTIAELSLRSMNLGPAEGAVAISLLPRSTALTKLSMFGVGVGDQGVRDMLPSLQASSSLRLLDLRENGVSKDVARQVCEAIRHLPLIQNVCGVQYDGLRRGIVRRVDLKGMSIGQGESVVLFESLQANNTVTHLDLRDAGVDDDGIDELLPFLRSNTALKYLDLRENDLRYDSGLKVMECMQPSLEVVSGVPVKAIRHNLIQELHLGGSGIGLFGGCIAVGMLQYNTSITSLNLSGVGLGMKAMGGVVDLLKRSQVLVQLDLRGNDLTLRDGLELLGALGDRRHSMQSFSGIPLMGLLRNEEQSLELSKKKPPIGAAEVGILCEALKQCSSLKSLDLSDNGQMGDEAIDCLVTALGRATQLVNIDLRGNKLTAKHGESLMKCLEQGKFLSKVCGIPVSDVRKGRARRLDLYFNNMGPMESVLLGKVLRGASFVTGLDLTRNFIGADGCVAIAASLSDLKNLKELGLGGNNIGEQGAKALAVGLVGLSSLERLYLYENNLGPKGSVEITKALRCMGQLQQLYMSYNSMGDVGCFALCSSLPYLTRLECLGLQNNDISAQGWMEVAACLESLSNMKYLNVQGHGLDAEDMADVAGKVRAAVHSCGGKVMVYV